MTTLLRRLAERAVRHPVPAPTSNGLHVLEEEHTAAPFPPVERTQGIAPSSVVGTSPAPRAAAPHAAADGLVPPRRAGEAVPPSPSALDTAAVSRSATAPAASPQPTAPATGVDREAATGATPMAVAVPVPVPVPVTTPADVIVAAVPVSAPVWRIDVAAPRERDAAASDDAQPTVQVRIGRLDVRTAPPPTAPVPPRPERASDGPAALELSDYLRGRRVTR